jgi:hypothetical protein
LFAHTPSKWPRNCFQPLCELIFIPNSSFLSPPLCLKTDWLPPSLVVTPMTTAKRSYQVSECPHWSNISSVWPLGVRAESSKNSYSLIFLFVGILKSNITVLIRQTQNT